MSSEDKIYMLRRQIENAAYDLIELGFLVDDLEEFFQRIIDDMHEAEDEESIE